MESYYDSQEKRNIILLKELNNQIKWFKSLTATTNGTSHDVEATDRKGRKVIIELKDRKGDTDLYINTYKTVLVEPLKISHMSKMQATSGFSNNEQRLYINFTDDGAIIFDMNKKHTLEFIPNHHHYDPGSKQYKDEDRFGIPVNEGIIYKKDNTGIYKILS